MPKKFYTKTLFTNHSEINISYREIAENLKVSLSTAKRYIHLDITNGWIERSHYFYGHPRTQRVCRGKNRYTLTILQQNAE